MQEQSTTRRFNELHGLMNDAQQLNERLHAENQALQERLQAAEDVHREDEARLAQYQQALRREQVQNQDLRQQMQRVGASVCVFLRSSLQLTKITDTRTGGTASVKPIGEGRPCDRA